jgi:aspartate carbamoyltransferase catalytic subunit
MGFAGRDFLDVTQYTRSEIEHILNVAGGFEETYKQKGQKKLADGKILATLFFQPSTRTQFSFQTAMLRLGGTIIGFAGTAYTAVAKGENLEDTIRMIDKYANIIAMRHPDPGSADVAASVAQVPVINGGDGTNRHPTQALLDLYSIRKFKGKIEGLNVALWGDNRYSRVCHSLSLGLAMFGANVLSVYPGNLSMPNNVVEDMREKYKTEPKRILPDEALKEADVLYLVGGVQDELIGGKSELADSERIRTKDEYDRNFAMNLNRLEKAGVKKDLIVMHPLPRRSGELSPDIDNTKYCGYFEEAGYGVPVRMALIALLLGLVE